MRIILIFWCIAIISCGDGNGNGNGGSTPDYETPLSNMDTTWNNATACIKLEWNPAYGVERYEIFRYYRGQESIISVTNTSFVNCYDDPGWAFDAANEEIVIIYQVVAIMDKSAFEGYPPNDVFVTIYQWLSGPIPEPMQPEPDPDPDPTPIPNLNLTGSYDPIARCVTLEWEPIEGAAGYEVRRSLPTGGSSTSFSVYADTTDTSFVNCYDDPDYWAFQWDPSRDPIFDPLDFRYEVDVIEDRRVNIEYYYVSEDSWNQASIATATRCDTVYIELDAHDFTGFSFHNGSPAGQIASPLEFFLNRGLYHDDVLTFTVDVAENVIHDLLISDSTTTILINVDGKSFNVTMPTEFYKNEIENDSYEISLSFALSNMIRGQGNLNKFYGRINTSWYKYKKLVETVDRAGACPVDS